MVWRARVGRVCSRRDGAGGGWLDARGDMLRHYLTPPPSPSLQLFAALALALPSALVLSPLLSLAPFRPYNARSALPHNARSDTHTHTTHNTHTQHTHKTHTQHTQIERELQTALDGADQVGSPLAAIRSVCK